MRTTKFATLALPLLIGCASTNAPVATAGSTRSSVDYGALLSASDRTAEDKALDTGRHPDKLLSFAGIEPGMRIGEICAAGGYTTELLARAVGPSGKVYAENPKSILEKFAEQPWSARLQRPSMSNVVRADRELDAPFPSDAQGLDVVVDVLFYHDTVWLQADRAKMNKAIYEALKPGGAYVIVDHSAKAGSGVQEVSTLHRIDEATLRAEVESAGFQLSDSADFLRNPSDTRDWNASPKSAGDKRGTSDRFVLKFAKH